MTKDIGIDLGTDNIIIYMKKKGIVVDEPAIVTIDTTNNQIIAVGNESKKMIGRTPKNIRIIKPIKNGIVTDYDIASTMIKEMMKKTNINNILLKPKVLISCPCNITAVEKETLIELVKSIGAKEVLIEEKPKRAAIGSGMKIEKPVGHMIVDIGSGTTDIAIISLNSIILSNSIKTAGDKLTRDLIKYIREKYNLLIGDLNAENIKKDFADIYGNSEEKLIIKGRNILTGKPETITITKEDTKKALIPSIKKIIMAIKGILEQASPELSSDIIDKGIVITGGTAILKGLQEYMSENLKMPILISQSPLTATLDGITVILNNTKK